MIPSMTTSWRLCCICTLTILRSTIPRSAKGILTGWPWVDGCAHFDNLSDQPKGVLTGTLATGCGRAHSATA